MNNYLLPREKMLMNRCNTEHIPKSKTFYEHQQKNEDLFINYSGVVGQGYFDISTKTSRQEVSGVESSIFNT